MIWLRIDPITDSKTKQRLIKSPKYLFFDLGIRRVCANEGANLQHRIMTDLFEQYVGTELIYQSQFFHTQVKVKYWRDAAGLEIDYVLDAAHRYIPIEVKWSDKPNLTDARHLIRFMQEYPNIKMNYIICRTPHRYQLTDKITTISWHHIKDVFEFV